MGVNPEIDETRPGSKAPMRPAYTSADPDADPISIPLGNGVLDTDAVRTDRFVKAFVIDATGVVIDEQSVDGRYLMGETGDGQLYIAKLKANSPSSGSLLDRIAFGVVVSGDDPDTLSFMLSTPDGILRGIYRKEPTPAIYTLEGTKVCDLDIAASTCG